MFQFPNRSGTSRHGAPVRNRQAVASTTVRRATGGRPVAFTLGNNGPITAQASSEITSRDTTQDSPCNHRNTFSNTPAGGEQAAIEQLNGYNGMTLMVVDIEIGNPIAIGSLAVLLVVFALLGAWRIGRVIR